MAQMIGSDPDALDRAASQLRSAADELDQDTSALSAILGSVEWLGAVAGRFLGTWGSTHRLRMTSTSQFIREAADKLESNARAQREASGEGSLGGLVPMPHLLRRLSEPSLGEMLRGTDRAGGLPMVQILEGLSAADSIKDLITALPTLKVMTELEHWRDLARALELPRLHSGTVHLLSRLDNIGLGPLHGLPMLDLLVSGTLALHSADRYGLSDARTMGHVVEGAATVLAWGGVVAVGAASAATVGAATATVGLGFMAGTALHRHTPIGDAMLEATTGGIDDLEQRVRSGGHLNQEERDHLKNMSGWGAYNPVNYFKRF